MAKQNRKLRKKPKTIWDVPENSEDLTVSMRMLKLVENRIDYKLDRYESSFESIGARFDRVDAKFEQVDAKFAEVDKRFDQVDAKFAEVDKRFDQVDRRFDQVDAKFVELRSEMHAEFALVRKDIAGLREDLTRMLILMEEQRAENRIVRPEGYGLLRDKNVDFDRRITRLETFK